MPLDYQAEYQKAYQDNRAEVLAMLQRGELDYKITSFCDTHGFDRQTVVDAIQSSPVTAATFAVNPNRQNFYEKAAARFIEQIPGVSSFTMLGNNQKIASQGGVHSRENFRRSGGHSHAKTIDFEWVYGTDKYYAYHKYTKDEGGTQNSQYRDLQAFIQECNPTTLRKTYFVAIADGDYYQRQNGDAQTLRVKRLQNLANGQSVFACRIDDLEGEMKARVTPVVTP